MLCPNCNSEVPAAANFCGACGTGLAEQCPLCGSLNPNQNRYCLTCGVDTQSTVPGMTLARVEAWREQFNAMGWWQLPDARVSPLYDLLAEQRAPSNPNEKVEPWIFCCPVAGRDWLIEHVQITNNPDLQAIRGQYEDLWVIATRTSLLAVELRKRWVLERAYANILSVNWRDSLFSVEFDSGQVMELKVKAAGPRWYDVAIVLSAPFSKDGFDSSYHVASEDIRTANAVRADFLAIFRQFWQEVLGA